MKTRADYNATLENSILVEVQEAIRGINQLKTNIEGLKKSVDKIGNTKGLKNFNKQIKQSTEMGKNFKSILGFGTVIAGARRAYSLLKEMNNESKDFVETTNLFNVSMGKGLEGLNQYYENAVNFQNDLQEKLGVNIAESMNYQALFNSMSKSMGISAKYAYILSENFTKLGYDLASLYNIDPENAMQKLRAGLAGQTKPLRDLGLDITQQSLQPIAESLGIVRSIKNMSQAEKMILRYIAVLKQAQIAQGDFANTMDSPANQLRIFNAQVIAFKRNMGNLWQGFLGGILPYVNAIMMVINELLKMVAKLFGFKVSEQNVNISAGIGVDDLTDDLGTATGKAKELKAQLMGFDEINNISLQDKTSGSSTGGASVGGVDQRLLDAMKEYDNLMDKVKNKATDIRDKIMEWLGFTKKVNPVTGEISWELKEGNTNLKKILNVTKLIVGLYIGAKALKLIGYLRTLTGVIKGTIIPTTSFQNGLSLISKGIKNTSTWLKLGAEQFKIYMKNGDGVTKSLGKTGKAMLSIVPKAVKVAGGIAGLVGSCSLAYKSMEDLSKGSISTQEGILKLTGSIAGATASGALLGSTFGPVGTVIGGLTGLVGSSVSAFIGYNTKLRENTNEIQELKRKHEETISTYNANIEAIEKNKQAQLVNIQVIKEEIAQLDSMIDSNGKVKDSYKERVRYILNDVNQALGTEYELTGNQISINGELIGSYSELKGSVDEYIKKKEEQIQLEAFQETYKEELKKMIELQKRLKEAEEKSSDTLKEKNKVLEEGRNQTNLLGMAVNGYKGLWADWNYNEATKEENKIREELNKTSENVQTSKENWINFYTDISNTSEDAMAKVEETTTQSLINQTKTVEDLTPEAVEAWRNLAENSSNEYQEKLQETDESTQLLLETLLGKVDTNSPEYIEKWRKMASDSKEKYDIALSKLPTDTSKKIQESVDRINEKQKNMNTAGKNIAEEAIKGADKKVSDNKTGIKSVGNWFVQGFLNAITGGHHSVWKAGWDLVGSALKGGNDRQKTGSPAKETIKMGNFFTEGYIIGLKKKQKQVSRIASDLVNTALGEMQHLNKEDITINPNDIKIDTSQFIDYGQISGTIATQSNISVDNNMIDRMGQACYNAFVNAMKTQGIKADVKVEADKEGIFKVVQTGAEEYAIQTGENPFPVMA